MWCLRGLTFLNLPIEKLGSLSDIKKHSLIGSSGDTSPSFDQFTRGFAIRGV
jgi:hypothetical protein